MDCAQAPDPWSGIELGSWASIPVAIGGELTAAAVLGAYRRGIFCQPRADPDQIALNRKLYAPDVAAGYIPVLPGDGDPYTTLWWRPAERFVIPVASLHISRSLGKTIARSRWTTTMDAQPSAVISACRSGREPCWLTDGLISALMTLADLGWVRSLEVTEGDELVGGVFGCAFEDVFVMDSAFHTRPDAAKAAIADLARRGAQAGIALLDTQVRSEYTVRMGAVSMNREEYLSQLGSGHRASRLPTGQLPLRRLTS